MLPASTRQKLKVGEHVFISFVIIKLIKYFQNNLLNLKFNWFSPRSFSQCQRSVGPQQARKARSQPVVWEIQNKFAKRVLEAIYSKM